MGDLSGIVGMAFVATFFNALNLTSLFFAAYFALRVNTVGAWILWAISVFILGPISMWAGLSSYAWSVFFVLAYIIVLILTILASIKACNNGQSCCTTDGRRHCGKGGKKKGCWSSCCSSCSNCGSCDSGCCNSGCGCCDDDCDDDYDCDDKDRCDRRKRKPTRSGGNRVHYD